MDSWENGDGRRETGKWKTENGIAVQSTENRAPRTKHRINRHLTLRSKCSPLLTPELSCT